jgi:hypothetical protein
VFSNNAFSICKTTQRSYKSSNSFISLLFNISIIFLLTFLGCEPRGENKSLDQVLENAISRYENIVKKAESKGLTPPVLERLTNLNTTLRSINLSDKNTYKKVVLQDIIDNLISLTPEAGYTTRPALGEIVEQYSEMLSLISDKRIDVRALQLLVARTYFLLASELDGVRFQLLEREKKVVTN